MRFSVPDDRAVERVEAGRLVEQPTGETDQRQPWRWVQLRAQSVAHPDVLVHECTCCGGSQRGCASCCDLRRDDARCECRRQKVHRPFGKRERTDHVTRAVAVAVAIARCGAVELASFARHAVCRR
eukprot:3193824-Prymnesium_polylepis.1